MLQKKTQEERLTQVEKDIKNLQENPVLPAHSHTGFDSDRVLFVSIASRTERYYHVLNGAQPATAANYGVFFIATATCYVSKFQEVHQVAGSDAGAVTLMLEKLTGTTALDSGVDVLASTLSLKATANTVQTATLTATNANRTLAVGNRLALKDTGVLTALVGVAVYLEVTFT